MRKYTLAVLQTGTNLGPAQQNAIREVGTRSHLLEILQGILRPKSMARNSSNDREAGQEDGPTPEPTDDIDDRNPPT
ncbi:MAG: hypothetical protein ACYDBQ_06175 [Thermoplasmatota archaeon]